MNTKLRTMKVSILMCILFGSTIIMTTTPSASAKLITYNSVLQMSYDESTVNNAVFQPDGAPVSIPITVKFKVEIPENFLSNFLMRIIFLQTFIITSAKVKLSIDNPPDWAAVSIANANVYPDITTNFSEVNTALIIAAHSDAPSEGFTLKIKAETESLLNKHVPPNSAELTIVFKPGYIPLIDVYTESPSRIVGPQETVTFPVKITNQGNKQTLVTARIITYPDGWSPLLSQSQIVIPSASESPGNNVGYMSFSITPPYGLGWHNDLETITLEFTPQFSPPAAGVNNTGTPVPFQVTVRNRGFSTPGFECIGVLAALVISVGLIQKFKKKQ
ncbi:MAG: hypothetical protein NT038_00240 [Euryarchaeota archaeon]|nr:hypothetical protein [Euryarchaeota archaeon]